MKHLVVTDDTHSIVMQYKAKRKFKSQDETVRDRFEGVT